MPPMKFLLAAPLCLLATLAHACTLRMAPEEWPPYIYTVASGRLGGVDLELIQAILRQAGCTLHLEDQVPTARRTILFQQGKLDLLLAASITPERRGYARFSRPYRHETVGLFALGDLGERLRGIDSFQNIADRKLSLLAPRIGFYGNDYERAIPQLNADGRRSTFSTFEQGMKMLEAGRGDLIMGDAFALRHQARLMGISVTVLPYTPFRAPVHLMLNASSTSMEQLARINQAITQLEQNGTLPAIRSRYGMN
jgi:polar amino acid transport system substrate-binding protein